MTRGLRLGFRMEGSIQNALAYWAMASSDFPSCS